MIDLVVVNHNSVDELRRFINTLLSDVTDEAPPWRLFIADNGSTDGSREYLSSLSRSLYSALDLNGNCGYAVACNKLAAQGTNPFIALLNADAWMTTADVFAMVELMELTGFEVMGPKQRDEQNRMRHGGIDGTNERPHLRGWGRHDPDDTMYKDTSEMVSVSGSAYFIRRDAWETLTACPTYRKIAPDSLGAFLPTQLYYEETWCSYHARAHDMKVVYTGAVSIGHTWAASTKGDNRKLASVAQESRDFFREACRIHRISCD